MEFLSLLVHVTEHGHCDKISEYFNWRYILAHAFSNSDDGGNLRQSTVARLRLVEKQRDEGVASEATEKI